MRASPVLAVAVVKPYVVLVTGSRRFYDRVTVVMALSDASGRAADGQPMLLRHGGAKGLDTLAGEVWADWRRCWPELFLLPEIFGAQWGLYGNSAGPIRNSEMVAAKPKADLCLGFPLPGSIGTWDCMEKAATARIKVINCMENPWTGRARKWA